MTTSQVILASDELIDTMPKKDLKLEVRGLHTIIRRMENERDDREQIRWASEDDAEADREELRVLFDKQKALIDVQDAQLKVATMMAAYADEYGIEPKPKS